MAFRGFLIDATLVNRPITATPRLQRGQAFLCAFDLIELDGADLQAKPFCERKARLAKLLAGKLGGIVINDHVATDGAALFPAYPAGLSTSPVSIDDHPAHAPASSRWTLARCAHTVCARLM